MAPSSTRSSLPSKSRHQPRVFQPPSTQVAPWTVPGWPFPELSAVTSPAPSSNLHHPTSGSGTAAYPRLNAQNNTTKAVTTHPLFMVFLLLRCAVALGPTGDKER